MESNNGEKFIGRLTLDLNKLKEDISQANKILEDLSKVKIDSIDIESGKKSIEVLRSIEAEFEKLKTASGKSFDSDIFRNIEEQLSKLGITLDSNTTKITKFYKGTSEEAKNGANTFKQITEQIDELGRKYQEIKNLEINENGEILDKGSVTKVTENLEKEEKARNEIQAAIKKTINAREEERRTIEENQAKNINKQLDQEEKDRQKIESEISKTINAREQERRIIEENQATAINKSLEQEYRDRQKITEQLEKQRVAELKEYTQIQANSSAYLKLSESISQISSKSSLAMGSGNANNTFLDRMKISAAYAGSAVVIASVTGEIRNAISTNTEYEKNLVDLGRVLDSNKKSLQDFGQYAVRTSKEFGQDLGGIQSAMSSLAAQGVSAKKDLESMTKTVSLGLNTSEITNSNEMVQLLVSSMKQLGINFSDSEKVLDSWNKTADISMAKTADFAQVTDKAGMTSKDMGISLNQLNGITAVLADNTGKSGNEIGDALKSMENRLERPKTLETLRGYGIEVMKDKDHFKDFGDIVKEVSSALDKFGDNTTQSNSILDALGGTMRKDWIDVLAKNWKDVDKFAKQSANSAGYSAKKNAQAMSTVEKQVKVLEASVKEFFVTLGQSGGLTEIRTVVNGANDVVQALEGVNKGFGSLLLLIPQVALAIKGLNFASNAITGKSWKQLFNDHGGESTASIKAYSSAVKSVQRDVASGNITLEESATILDVIRQKVGLSKAQVDIFAAAEENLKAKVAAGTMTEEEASEALEAMQIKMKATTVSAEEASSANNALSVAQKSATLSTMGLNLALGGIVGALTIGLSMAISDIIEKHEEQKQKVDKLKQGYEDLTKAMKDNSITADNDDYKNLEKEQSTLENALKRKAELEGKINSVNKSKKNDKWGNSLGDTGKLKDFQSELNKVNKVISETQKNLDTTGYSYDKTTGKIKLLSEASEQIANNKSIEGVARDLTENSDKAKTSIGQLIQSYVTLYKQSDKTALESQKQKGLAQQLALVFGDLTLSTDKNGDTIIKNASALQKDTEAFIKGNAVVKDAILNDKELQQAQEKINKAIQSTTNSYKSYLSYSNQIERNNKLDAQSVADIKKNHQELVPYLNNTKQLYSKIQQGISSFKNTVVMSYAQMQMAEQKNYSKLGAEYQQYTKLQRQISKNKGSSKELADAKKQVGKIAQDLANKIKGLSTVTDKNGNVTLKAGNKEKEIIKILKSEGNTYKELEKIKLGSSKSTTMIEDGNTAVTQKQAQYRIGYYTKEAKMIAAKAKVKINASTLEIKAGQALTSKAQKNAKERIKALQEEIDSLKEASKEIDKLFEQAQSAADSSMNTVDSDNIGDYASEDAAEKAEEKAEKAEEKAEKKQQEAEEKAERQREETQRKAEEAQRKAEEQQRKSLEEEKKHMDEALESSYKIEKQHQQEIIDMYKSQLDELEKKHALQESNNEQQEYENKLLEDKQKLENAQTEKTVRDITTGQWITDSDAIYEAQKQLNEDQKEYDQWKEEQDYKQQEDTLNGQLESAQSKMDEIENNYQNQKDNVDQSYESKEEALGGYVDGTDYVPESGFYDLVEDGKPELVVKSSKQFLPKGSMVINNENLNKLGSITSNQATEKAPSPNSSNDINEISVNAKPIVSLVKDITKSLLSFEKNSSNFSKNTLKNIGDAITDNKELTLTPQQKFQQDIDKTISQFVNNTINYGKNSDKNIGQGISDEKQNVIDPINLLTAEEAQLLNDFSKSCASYGSDLVTELGNGVKSSEDNLTNIVQDLTQKVITKFKEGFGIHSPSRVMYEIGDYLMQGLINGMSDNDVTEFIKSQVSSAIGVAGGGASG
ncbi:phage tail tape measure protein, partial [Clostridium acetobutylicum]|uniref:phage tail tape measure protein n=1 Tax=Clostridium acetobutylicum TaxID=1488 RepID=UPI000CF3D0B2